jgi:hypothetical protein
MTVERSALNKYGLKLDGAKYVEATAADLGTVTELGTVGGKKAEKIAYTSAATSLSDYYTPYAPNEVDYPKYGENKAVNTYVNFNKTETSDWSDRVKTITGAITGFNGNLNTYYFQRLCESGAITFADKDLEASIKNYSVTKRQSTVDDNFETWKRNWLEYAEMLEAQQAARFDNFGTIKGELITELAAISYSQANQDVQNLDVTVAGTTNLAGLWKEGGACYYGK